MLQASRLLPQTSSDAVVQLTSTVDVLRIFIPSLCRSLLLYCQGDSAALHPELS